MSETLYINGISLDDLGAEGMREYAVGGSPITNDFFQGRNRTSFNLLMASFGLKPIKFTLTFSGAHRREVVLKKTKVDGLLFGNPEIFLPDGFFYSCILDAVGDLVWEGQEGNEWVATVEYSLKGIQHDPLEEVTGGEVFCRSTTPFTDCVLSVTASAAAESYQLGGATFQNVQAGEKLTFDGINKRALRNGAPAAANVYFINFPQLTPGVNTFTAADPITVQYYPTYL